MSMFFYQARQPMMDADGAGGSGGSTTPPTTNTPPVNTNPDSKVWTDEYVKSLREESKAHRLTAKTYESKLREALGLNPDADISNLDALINSHKESTTKQIAEAMNKANESLIKAEIKSVSDKYDVKLLDKLLDKSKITIENGEVKGLTEALTELEKEFPVILKTSTPPNNRGFNPPNGSGSVDIEKMSMEEYYAHYSKRNK